MIIYHLIIDANIFCLYLPSPILIYEFKILYFRFLTGIILKMYDKNRMLSEMVCGLFNGLIFSLCWGSTYGSYHAYNPKYSKKQYLAKISKYVLVSNLQIVPIFVLSRVVHSYLKDQKYEYKVCAGITFVVSFIGFVVIEQAVRKIRV